MTKPKTVDQETFFMSPRRVTRKMEENEAMLIDKDCPVCLVSKLIFVWNSLTKSYDPKGRCSSLKCVYGNGKKPVEIIK